MADDRTIHAYGPGGAEVVRYDRAGKWYREMAGLPRVPLRIEDAVYQATCAGWVWNAGLPGGKRFDALVGARRIALGLADETL